MPNYPHQSVHAGRIGELHLLRAAPFVVLAQLVVGQEFLENTGGDSPGSPNRLYIQPGVMIKFNTGQRPRRAQPGVQLERRLAVVHQRLRPEQRLQPAVTGFVDESAADPHVLFTSLFDDQATTTLVPNPINVTNETAAQSASQAGSGGVGQRRHPERRARRHQRGHLPVWRRRSQHAGLHHPLAIGARIHHRLHRLHSQSDRPDDSGTHVYITNNNFFNNFDAAMQIEPNGLMAGNPLTPLESGNPFLRGNVMTGNGIDGLMVLTNQLYFYPATILSYLGPEQAISAGGGLLKPVGRLGLGPDRYHVRSEGTLIIGGAY